MKDIQHTYITLLFRFTPIFALMSENVHILSCGYAPATTFLFLATKGGSSPILTMLVNFFPI